MLVSCASLMSEFNCSVLLVHHTGVAAEAQKRGRGSSSWRGAMDVEMSVAKEGDTVVLACTKSKDEKEPTPEYLKLEEIDVPGWFDEDGNPETTAVVLEGEKPQQKEDAALTDAKNMFRFAWKKTGYDMKDGAPYVTRSAWINVMVASGDATQDTAQRNLRPIADRKPLKQLIPDFLKIEGAGFVAIGQFCLELNAADKADK